MTLYEPMPSKGRSASRWLAALLVLASFALRVFRLGDANVWWDEALAIWAVRKGLYGVTAWTASDVHPPLYFWSLWGWVQVFGEGELAARLLSALFGVLTVVIVYRLGRRLRGERVGLLAAFLTGFSRFHIWWSQELRMYALAGLLGLLSIYHFLGWLRTEATPYPARAKDRWWHLGGAALYGLGSLYTVLIMGGLFLVENLVVLVHALVGGVRRRVATLGRWVIGQLLVVAGLAVWLTYSWDAMSTWSVTEPFGLGRAASLYATLLTTGVSVEIERYAWLVAAFMLLFFAGAVAGLDRLRSKGRSGHEAWDLLTLFLVATVPPLLVYAATLPRALFYTPRLEARYLIPFATAFWVLLAWALDALIERWRIVGWAGVIAVATLWLAVLPEHYRSRYLGDELQSMVRTIASQSRYGDLVLVDSGTRYPIWSYYYDGLDWRTPKPPVVYLGDDSRKLTSEGVALSLPDIVAKADRIWLAEVDIALTDPDRLVPAWLDERHTQVQALGFGANTLRLYDASREPPTLAAAYQPITSLSCKAETYHLIGVDVPVPVVAAGTAAQVGLLWELAPMTSRLVGQNVHGHLLMARPLSQPDRQDDVRQQVELPIPNQMPDGAYALSLELSSDDPCVLPGLRVKSAAWPEVAESPVELVGAALGDIAELEGYALYYRRGTVAAEGEAAFVPGETVVLDLYWRARGPAAHSYTVFAQILGDAFNPATQGPVWGQDDSPPAGNAAPTDAWRTGDLVLDRHAMTLDPEAPEGLYHIQVGMYDPATGSRLPVKSPSGEDWGDRVLLSASVRVRS
jgi:4-amino-4-deoxy-L-arabinose transferase-like glycosyltransferase